MTSTPQAPAELALIEPIRIANGVPRIHVAKVSRYGGFSLYCTGRHIAIALPAAGEVTCKSCIRKAAAAGVDTTEL